MLWHKELEKGRGIMIEICEATELNIDDLVKYRIELLRDCGGVREDTDITVLEKSLEDYFARNLGSSFMSWVAKLDEEVIGISGLNIIEKPPTYSDLSGLEGYIMNIFVDPNFRRRGIGTELLKAILKYTDERRIFAVTLLAEEKGVRIYEKLGFKPYDKGMVRINR